MLTILALLATFVMAPIEDAGGLDYAYPTEFEFSVQVGQGETAYVNVYDENGLVDSFVFDSPGTYSEIVPLGYYDGTTDDITFHASCAWVDGTPPYPQITHYFYFPEDFTFYPKYWHHGYHF